jgi:hypothetical protein
MIMILSYPLPLHLVITDLIPILPPPLHALASFPPSHLAATHMHSSHSSTSAPSHFNNLAPSLPSTLACGAVHCELFGGHIRYPNVTGSPLPDVPTKTANHFWHGLEFNAAILATIDVATLEVRATATTCPPLIIVTTCQCFVTPPLTSECRSRPHLCGRGRGLPKQVSEARLCFMSTTHTCPTTCVMQTLMCGLQFDEVRGH